MELVNLRRFLSLAGESDTWPCPEWYPIFQASRFIGVAPWELAAQSVWWRQKALIAMEAEEGARKILEQHKK